MYDTCSSSDLTDVYWLMNIPEHDQWFPLPVSQVECLTISHMANWLIMVVQSPLLFHFKSQYHRRGRHSKCEHKTLQGNFCDTADRTSDKIIDRMVNVQRFQLWVIT